jgi:chloramphenicol O-acetyltransferase type A
MATWARRGHFDLYRAWDDPTFNVAANVDLTALLETVRAQSVSVTAAIVFLIARTANGIPEFRWRIRGESVVEHDVVHPSSTVLGTNDLFGFCDFDYTPRFEEFAAEYAVRVAAAQAAPSLDAGLTRDDVLYMTAIPWVSFTSFSHPMPTTPPDSVPRIAWGRFFEVDDRSMMPLSVQGHHALMDGLHIGRFFEAFQADASNPERALGL